MMIIDDNSSSCGRRLLPRRQLLLAIADLPSLSLIIQETGLESPETKARAQLSKSFRTMKSSLSYYGIEAGGCCCPSSIDELHPPSNSDDCIICLETIKYTWIPTQLFDFFAAAVSHAQSAAKNASTTLKWKDLIWCCVTNVLFVEKRCLVTIRKSDQWCWSIQTKVGLGTDVGWEMVLVWKG